MTMPLTDKTNESLCYTLDPGNFQDQHKIAYPWDLKDSHRVQCRSRAAGNDITWLNVDLSFLPFLLARAFASAAAAAAMAEEAFLEAGFLGLGGTFLKPPCNSRNITLTAGTAISHKVGQCIHNDKKKEPVASSMLVSDHL